MRDSNQTAEVISSYNFQCLLNIPQAMRRFGSLRNFWEGGVIGEGFLPLVKTSINQGLRQNWEQNLLRNILCQKAFDNITRDRSANVLSPNDTMLSSNRTKFKVYNGTVDLIYTWRVKMDEPISLIVVAKGMESPQLYAVLSDYKRLIGVRAIAENNTITKVGLTYHDFELCKDGSSEEWQTLFSNDDVLRIDYCVLLPLLGELSQDVIGPRKFALISSNWNSLGDGIATNLSFLL